MLKIDTGPTATRPPIPDWFIDLYPDGTPDDKLIHDFAYHLMGAMDNPKKFETVRNHTLANWPFLRLLGETHPDVFDEFFTAFVERWQA